MAPLSLSLSFLLGLIAFNTVISYAFHGDMAHMEDGELSGLFDLMGSLLDDPTWAQVHPQPCTNTPWPGLQCELVMAQENQQDYNPPLFHVTKIHVGPDIVTPPCKHNATLSPRSLLSLPYLKTLSLYNCFTVSPFSLSTILFENDSLSSLEHLALVGNPSLEGGIPSRLGQIQSLKIVSLSQNNLTGEIPDQIAGLVKLKQLDLSYNAITGSVPEAIGGLKSLTIFDLSYNKLHGQLPSSIGQLRCLEKIDLGFNDISGRVPQELGELTRLVLLDLSHNSIAGPLPESLAGLKHVEYLIMDHNPINTGMPLFIGSLVKAKVLSFSRCGLVGPMLTTLSRLKSLSDLSLDQNRLNGTVPTNIGSLSNLEQLNLSQNELSGELFLSEEFVTRIGRRLDVRRNNGLCIKKNISSTSNEARSSTCIRERSRSGGNKSSWGEEGHQDECENMNPSFYQSNGGSMNCHGYGLDQLFLLMVFLFV